jgi:hypothetical protein
MKTNKEYNRLEQEVVRLLNERDEAIKALRWCLRQMPEPSIPGDYTEQYKTAYAASVVKKGTTPCP